MNVYIIINEDAYFFFVFHSYSPKVFKNDFLCGTRLKKGTTHWRIYLLFFMEGRFSSVGGNSLCFCLTRTPGIATCTKIGRIGHAIFRVSIVH